MSDDQQNNVHSTGSAGQHPSEANNDKDPCHVLNDPSDRCPNSMIVAQLPLADRIVNQLQWLWPPMWWRVASFCSVPWQWNRLWQSAVIGVLLPTATTVLIQYAHFFNHWAIRNGSDGGAGDSEGMTGVTGLPARAAAPEHYSHATASTAALLSYDRRTSSMTVSTLISTVSKSTLFVFHLPITIQ